MKYSTTVSDNGEPLASHSHMPHRTTHAEEKGKPWRLPSLKYHLRKIAGKPKTRHRGWAHTHVLTAETDAGRINTRCRSGDRMGPWLNDSMWFLWEKSKAGLHSCNPRTQKAEKVSWETEANPGCVAKRIKKESSEVWKERKRESKPKQVWPKFIIKEG